MDTNANYTAPPPTPTPPPSVYDEFLHIYPPVHTTNSTATAAAPLHPSLPRLSVHSNQQLPPPAVTAAEVVVHACPILYTSVGLVLLHAMQFGWMIPQLNLSTFQDQDACDARPVLPNTCVMFPGHTAGEWAWVINLWIVGGMVSSLGCARVADRFGRKPALIANAVLMIVGGTIQASAPTVGVYAVGRLVSGLASGASTAIPNGFINEVSPPHLRNRLGVLYQVALCAAIVMVGITFFFANTYTGWRYIGGFPIVLGGLFLVGAPQFMVESPTWLLTHGYTEEAERVLTRLYGEQNVQLALAWMAESAVASSNQDQDASEEHSGVVADGSPMAKDRAQQQLKQNPFRSLFLPAYRQQTLLAIMLSLSQRLSGINTAFLYSSSLFNDAGLADDRIGSMIINIVDFIPVFFSGVLGSRFGNRRMIIVGLVAMMLSSVGVTVSLLLNSGPMSIVFTATFVAAFAVSLGPLIFVVATSIFPHALRASGTSLCLFANWCGTLLVGVSYPHVAKALGDYSFVPFIVCLAIATVYMMVNLPDTTGKTGDEIQLIFQERLERKQMKKKNGYHKHEQPVDDVYRSPETP